MNISPQSSALQLLFHHRHQILESLVSDSRSSTVDLKIYFAELLLSGGSSFLLQPLNTYHQSRNLAGVGLIEFLAIKQLEDLNRDAHVL